jgi:hypothetical protein
MNNTSSLCCVSQKKTSGRHEKKILTDLCSRNSSYTHFKMNFRSGLVFNGLVILEPSPTTNTQLYPIFEETRPAIRLNPTRLPNQHPV